MLEVDVPGFGRVTLQYLVTDFTGTLSVDGTLIPGARSRLRSLARILAIHVLTADTFGTARTALQGTNSLIHLLSPHQEDVQKERYVRTLGPESVVAMGNGNNDRRMLRMARVGIAVLEREGAAGDAVRNADIVVRKGCDGLDLLLHPQRMKASLRF